MTAKIIEALNRIISMAGNPDPSEGCRLIIKEVQQILKEIEE